MKHEKSSSAQILVTLIVGFAPLIAAFTAGDKTGIILTATGLATLSIALIVAYFLPTISYKQDIVIGGLIAGYFSITNYLNHYAQGIANLIMQGTVAIAFIFAIHIYRLYMHCNNTANGSRDVKNH